MNTVISHADVIKDHTKKTANYAKILTPHQSIKSVWEYKVIDKIPKLKGIVCHENAPFFYKEIENYIKKIPPEKKLILDLSDLQGNSSLVASMAEIGKLLQKKKIILSYRGASNQLTGALNVHKLTIQNFIFACQQAAKNKK